jgi:uncharacterized membrane protein
MDGLAIILVLSAALVHALWNLMVKKAGGGLIFIWLFASVSVAVYAPISAYIIWINRLQVGPLGLLFIIISALLHLIYFLILQRGYKKGDLSLVYPLARGTGPMLSVLAAILFFGERPGTLAIIGASLIIFGVFNLSGGLRLFLRHEAEVGWALRYGIFSGVFIASYTLWDKQAVSVLMIPPIILDWASSITRMIVLCPYAVKRWREVKDQWKQNKRFVVGVAVFNPLSYILILTALVFAPVSYIAPARELSILFATLLGTRLLAERHSRQRLISACIIILGVIGLSLG